MEPKTDPLAKHRLYESLVEQVRSLLEDERDVVANAANCAAVLYHGLPQVNWVGFYFVRGDELVLGPFQGQVACVRIALGRGVCGTSAQRRETLVVADVHAFPGHIACDAASRSEVVVPLVHPDDGTLLGVLDVDSPRAGRFDEEDARGLELLASVFLRHSDLRTLAPGAR